MAAAWDNVAAFAAINGKYSLEMRFDSVPELCRQFNLIFPDLP